MKIDPNKLKTRKLLPGEEWCHWVCPENGQVYYIDTRDLITSMCRFYVSGEGYYRATDITWNGWEADHSPCISARKLYNTGQGWDCVVASGLPSDKPHAPPHSRPIQLVEADFDLMLDVDATDPGAYEAKSRTFNGPCFILGIMFLAAGFGSFVSVVHGLGPTGWWGNAVCGTLFSFLGVCGVLAGFMFLIEGLSPTPEFYKKDGTPKDF